MSQTADLAPADKKLYHLRDVTGTVESIPLIASSIMSKKLAAGSDNIVLDIKCGSGAFMKDIESAEKLAKTMLDIGKNSKKGVIAVISDMNYPLGMYIGNSLEVIEAINVLKGKTDGALKEVSLTLGACMLLLNDMISSVDEGIALLDEKIKDGSGIEKFRELIKSQGGNPSVIDDTDILPVAKIKREVVSQCGGYLYSADTHLIGKASLESGAGQHTKDDIIDYGAGIILKYRPGNYIKKGDVIAEIYSSSNEKADTAYDILTEAFKITLEKPKERKNIIKIIRGEK